jgi:acyl-coenzyme A thioesterase PaaI-like protein
MTAMPAPVRTAEELTAHVRDSVTDILVYAGGDERPVAQATVTYAPL